ncbi:MAG: MCE family protein [Bdellovibrionales bacterium]|nr:MCE family protein [Bdellovibrionales bacterium]
MKAEHDFSAGIFLVGAIALFAISVLTLGHERELFSKQDVFQTAFSDVKGLKEGAPVRMGGLTVGRVERINFAQHQNDRRVHVDFLINSKFLNRMRRDNTVSIETQGLLGDRFLNVKLGASSDVLAPGSDLESEESGEIEEVIGKTAKIIDNTEKASEDLQSLFSELRNNTLNQITEAASRIATFMQALEQEEGIIPRLIYSKKDGSALIQDIRQSADNIKEITESVRKGDGLLHAMVYDQSGGKSIEGLTRAANNLADAAAAIGSIAEAIKQGEGLAHQIFYGSDETLAPDIFTKLEETAENLRVASKALSTGTGTLGALIIDPKLYDNLVEVTDDAKRSIILREAIRSSLAE